MTLIVAVTGPQSIWLLADRRLTYAGRRPPKDDARKIIFLETTDDRAILAYAGLGATALGTEPSDWMSAVLRGRKLPLEKCLDGLAAALQKQFPQHMARMPASDRLAHHVIIPAFIGEEPRLYTIDLVFAPDRKSYKFRYTHHITDKPPASAPRPPRLGMGGSGALYLDQDRKWMRVVLHLVKAHDRGRISPNAVADYLAIQNYNAHLAVTDKSVGPRCIVAWRFRKGGVHGGGGGQQFYSHNKRDASPSLPTISNGKDVHSIVEVMLPRWEKWSAATLAGEPVEDLDIDEINAALACLPHEPDENLR